MTDTNVLKEANKTIADKIEAAESLIRECETIADQHGLEFRWEGPSYGMGGYYIGKDPSKADWSSSTRDCEGGDGWSSSSSNC